MLLIYLHAQTGIPPVDIDVTDVNAEAITGARQRGRHPFSAWFTSVFFLDLSDESKPYWL
jgi:hypothetical protein